MAGVEGTVARIVEGIMMLYDAIDADLRDPNNPEQYSLSSRVRDDRVIWEEPIEENGVVTSQKKSGTLQALLDLAFPSGCNRRFVRVVSYPDQDLARLLLDTTDRMSTTAEFLAKLEGRFKKVEKDLNQGNTIQLSVLEAILRQHGKLQEQGH
jgi:hypothetical protein